jgi:hypothetical protein
MQLQLAQVLATASAFGGDPCVGTLKRLAVRVVCSGESTAGSPVLLQEAQLPVGTSAQLAVPLLGAVGLGNITVNEGDAVVWSGGRFVSGVPGVLGAEPSAESSSPAIVFTLASGKYSFSSW